MKIIKADTLGYCMGVRRAVESAEVALKEYTEKKVYSLGPLIHNPVALDELEEKGLNTIQENQLDRIENDSVVIIRAHGVSPIVKKTLEEKNISIIDSTCPRVTVSQNRVAEFSKKGYSIILAGDKGHAEVEGIKGYCQNNFYCVQNLLEAKNLPIENTQQNFLLLSQTTFSLTEFLNISEYLKTKLSNLEIINTICPATKQRQDALERLCNSVDGIIVIGGKKSANTIRLFQKARTFVSNAIHIEKSSEIPLSFYKLKTIGITAGASTPDNVIEEVIECLKDFRG